jgi:hypothetical protein
LAGLEALVATLADLTLPDLVELVEQEVDFSTMTLYQRRL